VLYSAGYVHRDISVGNVLLCEGTAKISDLEYARPFEALVNAKGRTELSQPRNKELKTVRTHEIYVFSFTNAVLLGHPCFHGS
jgi:serine/threonine protein kinase